MAAQPRHSGSCLGGAVGECAVSSGYKELGGVSAGWNRDLQAPENALPGSAAHRFCGLRSTRRLGFCSARNRRGCRRWSQGGARARDRCRLDLRRFSEASRATNPRRGTHPVSPHLAPPQIPQCFPPRVSGQQTAAQDDGQSLALTTVVPCVWRAPGFRPAPPGTWKPLSSTTRLRNPSHTVASSPSSPSRAQPPRLRYSVTRMHIP